MTELDLAQLRAEIAAEVRARRASGEYSPGLERRLDALFTRFSPPETHDDFDASIEVASHPIGRSDVDLVLTTVGKIKDSAVLEETANNAAHVHCLRQP